ncbi:MAG TPA: hypothetical protein VLB76_15635 [Thermoanaerobaculia bacterium]|jgi:hypothetical protein|nr:hypothetical protein [Thermoanaerobaculia bacterium]
MIRSKAFWLAAVLCGGHAWTLAAAPPASTETAVFSMYCYWTGEATVGRVPGVVRTRIGEFGGEVVEVTYDPARTDVVRLAAALKRQGSFYALIAPDRDAAARTGLPASDVKVRSGQPDFIEPKHSLRVAHPELYYLDLTEAQAIALNTWSHFGGPRPAVLTPEQESMAAKLKARLAAGRAPGEPARSGPERERYRQTLMAWLGE